MKKMILTILVILAGAYPVQADTVWLSGHHVITDDNDPFGEIRIYNDVTLDILGGDIYMLETFDVTATDWYAGETTELFSHDDSIVNIYGGQLSRLQATENSVINLYAYDVIHTTTGGYWDAGQVTGKYLNDNSNFVFDLHYTAYSHITVVPEPVMDAEIDIQPNTLNLSSKGKWLTCRIWLPEDCNVADVNSASVFLEDELAPDWIWFNEKQNVVMAKFSRSNVDAILEAGEIELRISGRLTDGTLFEGTDTIKVIDKGRSHKGRVNSNSKVVDGIEYYIQTDKAVYNLGEEVEMLYRMTNLGDEEVTFGFPGSPEWNFWVEKDGENIWTAVEGWWWIGSGFTLAPSEYKEYPYEWDMRDHENNLLVNVGRGYSVIGGLDGAATEFYDFTRISVGIKIVPEPKGRFKHN